MGVRITKYEIRVQRAGLRRRFLVGPLRAGIHENDYLWGLPDYLIVSDYYDVLNLHQSASPEDIKWSFRQLALKHHPDKNRNSEDSKKKFMEVVEAYEILSDDQSRKEYDRTYKYKEFSINREWTPPADWQQVYSYEHLKKEYNRSHFAGGMWDISDRDSGSLWKATLFLFAGLLGLVAFILWIR